MTIISEWAVRDNLTGVVYPQPNKLIAEKVADIHRQCTVIPYVTEAKEEYACDYPVLMAKGSPRYPLYPAKDKSDALSLKKYVESRLLNFPNRGIEPPRLMKRTVTYGEWEEVTE